MTLGSDPKSCHRPGGLSALWAAWPLSGRYHTLDLHISQNGAAVRSELPGPPRLPPPFFQLRSAYGGNELCGPGEVPPARASVLAPKRAH